MAEQGLKLRVRDADDLAVLSAVLQDALVALKDVSFLPAEQRFVLVANRFCWELAGPDDKPQPLTAAEADAPFAEDGPHFLRRHCGLILDKVENVKARGLDLRDKDQLLNLLAIAPVQDAAGQAVVMAFSGGGELRIGVTALRLHLQDLGEAWTTSWRPRHSLDEPDAPG